MRTLDGKLNAEIRIDKFTMEYVPGSNNYKITLDGLIHPVMKYRDPYIWMPAKFEFYNPYGGEVWKKWEAFVEALEEEYGIRMEKG